MPNVNKASQLKMVVLHNVSDELATPLSPRDVTGKFEGLTVSPAATGTHVANVASPFAQLPHVQLPHVHCDGHLHPTSYDQKGTSLLRLIQMANAINLMHFVAMRIPTNVLSLQADKHYKAVTISCGERYYLDESAFATDDHVLTQEIILKRKKLVELHINSEVDLVQAAEYLTLTEDQKERVDLAITGLHLGDPRSQFALLEKIKSTEAPFSLVGEVTLAKEVVMHLIPNESQAHLKSHMGPFNQLTEVIGLTGMPMTLHCDVDHAIPSDIRKNHPANLNGMMTLLAHEKSKYTTIIWAHFAGISRFGPIPENHYETVKYLLNRFPNLMIDLSWSRIAKKIDHGKVAALIEEFPDRFIMGSDALAPVSNEVLSQTYDIYAGPGNLLSRLSDDVREKVLVTNYVDVIRAGREKCKKFKEHILPGIENLIGDPAVDSFKPTEMRNWMLREYESKDPEYYKTISAEVLSRNLTWDLAAAFGQNNASPISQSTSDSDKDTVGTASRLSRHLSRTTSSREQIGESAGPSTQTRRSAKGRTMRQSSRLEQLAEPRHRQPAGPQTETAKSEMRWRR